LAARFIPNSGIRGDDLIAALIRHTPLLVQYKSSVLVLYGAIFDEHLRSDGSRDNVVRKLLMLDPRHQDRGRWVSFLRDKDDWNQVAGVVSIEPQGM
jgi:hypothetical protein